MKPLEAIVIAFYVAVAVFSIYYGAKVISAEPQLMCGVVEISPDFSAADRARCRQTRGHKL
jgi:hypothetical protein